MKIAIIGAGVSGLTAAQLLQSGRYGQNEVEVFEQEATPGGLVRCERIGGSLFHLCGGHIFNTRKSHVWDFFWSQFREEEFTKADRNSTVQMPDADCIPYPIENHVYMLGEALQHGVLHDLMEMCKAEGSEAPRNFSEFLQKRFGPTLYELYFRPYNEKVWRRDLSEVPLDWLEGKLPMPTVEEILFNNFNHVAEKQFVHSTFWYEKQGGSQFLANRLAEGLNIRYNARIGTLQRDGEGWLLDGRHYDAVVYTGNVKALPALVGIDLSAYAARLAALESHGTTSVFCHIDRNPYSWIYLPDRRFEAHRIICTGNFSPTNNAASEQRLTATVEFTDEVSREHILEQLSRMPFHPEYIAHHYSQYTYPIQSADTRQMISSLKSTLASRHFYLTGRFADWEYYNMDAAMDAAMRMVEMMK